MCAPLFLLPLGISSYSVSGSGQWAFFCRARTRGSIHRRGWAVLRAEVHATPRTFGLCSESFVTVDTIYLAFGTLDAMWLAFQSLTNNKIPAFTGAHHFALPASSSGVRSSAPSGPRSAGNRRDQGRTPSQSPAWHTGSRNNPVVMNVNKSIPDCTDP